MTREEYIADLAAQSLALIIVESKQTQYPDIPMGEPGSAFLDTLLILKEGSPPDHCTLENHIILTINSRQPDERVLEVRIKGEDG